MLSCFTQCTSAVCVPVQNHNLKSLHLLWTMDLMRHKIWRDTKILSISKATSQFCCFSFCEKSTSISAFFVCSVYFATHYSCWGNSEFVLQYHEGWFPNSKHRATFALELLCYTTQLLKGIVISLWEDYAGSTVTLLKCLQQLRSWGKCRAVFPEIKIGIWSDMIRYLRILIPLSEKCQG